MQDQPTTINQEQKPLINRWIVVGGVVLIVVLVGLLTWGVVWVAFNHPDAVEAFRDIMIIALAFGVCLFGFSLILLTIMVIRLVNMLEFEIRPILEQTNDTLRTLRGTTHFVSQNVVKPVARATGYVSGIRRGLKVLFGDPRKNFPD